MLEILEEMKVRGVPASIETYNMIVSELGKENNSEKLKEVLEMMKK